MEFLKKLALVSLLFIEIQYRVLGVNLSLVEVLIAVTFIVMIFKINDKRDFFQSVIKDRLLRAYAVYLVIFLIILIYQFYNSPINIIKYLVIIIFGFAAFFCFYISDNNEKNYYKFFNVILIVAVFVILFGIFEVINYKDTPLRFDSIFWGISNRMASRFLLLIPISFFLAKYKNRYYYIPFYILILGIVMTVSRGAIVVLLCFLLINIKDFFKRKNILNTIMGFSIISLLCYKLGILSSLFYRSSVLENQLSEEVKRNALNALSNGSASSISRIELWKHAWQLFIQSPIMGNGMDKYAYSYLYYGEKVFEVNAHNWVLHILAEVGVVGLIATLILIIFIAKKLYKNYISSKATNNMDSLIKSKIGIWVMILFLGHNLAEASINSVMFGYGSVTILFIIIIGICLSGSYKEYFGLGVKKNE